MNLSRQGPISDREVFDLIEATDRQYQEYLAQLELIAAIEPQTTTGGPVNRLDHPLQLVIYTSRRPPDALLD